MHGQRPRTVLVAALWFPLSALVAAQQTPPTPVSGKGNTISLLGCLSQDFSFVDKNMHWYTLVGATAELNKYAGGAVRIQDTENASADPSSPTLHGTSIQPVPVKVPPLSSSFSNVAAWHTSNMPIFGLKFSYPASFSMVDDAAEGIAPNFPVQTGTVGLGNFKISDDIYPGSNFEGGAFSLFVNTKISNRATCEQFGKSDPRYLSSVTIGGTRYAVSNDSGVEESDYAFHAFQNGLCYELDFAFGEGRIGPDDLGCFTPGVSDTDEWNLMKPLLRAISYVPASLSLTPPHADVVPTVTSFNSSSDVADDVTTPRGITLTWSTRNADYIELTYHCAADVSNQMLVSEAQETRDCGSRIEPTFPLKRSPNGSITVGFGNFHQDDPVPVLVTLTPFRGATAYSDSRKSLTIAVDPQNPFPQGARTGAHNIALSYLPGPGKSATHRQGSSMTIHQGASMTIQWSDAEKRDTCVNLFLVQNDARGVPVYRSRAGERKCVPFTGSGSYTWQLPHKFSGPGFRIYATSTSDSWALGERFDIAR